MSDKTFTKAELEVTQKMQVHFPWGAYAPEVLRKLNGCKVAEFRARQKKMFDEWIAEYILLPLYTTHLPAIIGDFIVEERFAEDISDDVEVKISGRGRNFIKWFGNVIEKPIGESELNVQQLQKNSVDRPIIGEIGGSEKAGIFLQQIWSLMRELQAKGETDGCFVGYKEDIVRFPADEPFVYKNKEGVRSVLRAVDFDWGGGGWYLNASLVSLPDGWGSGIRILSGNSFVA